MKPFIITLTGPSACGKGLVTKAIIDYSHKLAENGIFFKPFIFRKDVTRTYRFNEALTILKGELSSLDVNSVPKIPDTDDLVYRTYGDEYALSSIDLTNALKRGESPIVVINDVRVVEELKRIYEGQVLSLFIFRHIIPDVEQHKKASSARGGITTQKTLSRYEKAVALYRVFIENIHMFDRVILNVKEDDIELCELQARGIIDGVINGKIKLNKTIKKGPKLFIVSGNAASGKDDIIKAAKQYGKNQTDILIKSTSRPEEDGDVGEIICKYTPNKDKLNEYTLLYQEELKRFEQKFTLQKYIKKNRERLFKEYKEYISKGLESLSLTTNDVKKSIQDNITSNLSFETFVEVSYFLDKIVQKKSILTPEQRFWVANNKAKKNCRKEKGEIPKEQYELLLKEYFEINKDIAYIPLDEIRAATKEQYEKGIAEIEDPTENKSWYVCYDNKQYVFYENNQAYGEPFKYGFEIGEYLKEWQSGARKKHLVLTASLPNMFRIIKEKFGDDNVITAFTYSQISQSEHEAHSDMVTGRAKSREYNDIIRYARHIADFDYALIFAETSLTNLSGNQKDELVDQMFRLFRVYNEEIKYD